jgi:hypothetical protein
MKETTSLHLAPQAKEQHMAIHATAELCTSLHVPSPSGLGHRDGMSL